jgi:hypothetical protein
VDFQDIEVNAMSYAFSTVFCAQELNTPAVVYNSDYDSVAFLDYPIWNTDKGDFTSQVYKRDLSLVQGVHRIYDVSSVKIRVHRDGEGIVICFAMPILILLLLTAAIFCTSIESRVETTMTVLLSILALYVVIIANIPLLEYLTKFGKWIVNMYIFLTVCVAVHQSTSRIILKADEWPFKLANVRMVELIGRVFIILAVLISF